MKRMNDALMQIRTLALLPAHLWKCIPGIGLLALCSAMLAGTVSAKDLEPPKTLLGPTIGGAR
ncbi:MAG: hypothetical protein ACAI35_21510 [Candidatus Methylacidiphilales bacterium]